jgi:uncharacterized membrane protein YfcA
MLESLLSQLSQSFQTHSLTFFIFAILSVLLVGISKSGFGAGLGTLSLPLLASQVSVAEALAILLPLLIAIDLVGLRRFLRNANWKILSLVLPSAAVGILIGMIFFAVIAPQVLTLCIGIFILLYLLQDLVMSYFESNKAKLSPWLGILLSILSGVTSFVAHNGGPPITAYMLREKLAPMVYTSTLGIFFACLNFAKVGPYAYLGLIQWDYLITSILILPCVPIGVYFGFYLAKHIPVNWYYRIVRFFLLVAGVKLLIDGLA